VIVSHNAICRFDGVQVMLVGRGSLERVGLGASLPLIPRDLEQVVEQQRVDRIYRVRKMAGIRGNLQRETNLRQPISLLIDKVSLIDGRFLLT